MDIIEITIKSAGKIAFLYILVSFSVYIGFEIISVHFKLRQKMLYRWIKRMLCENDELTKVFYSSHNINPFGLNYKSYKIDIEHVTNIRPLAFVDALSYAITSTPQEFKLLKRDIENLRDDSLRITLMYLFVGSNNDVDLFREKVAQWFSDCMRAASIGYRNQAFKVCFIIGFIVSFFFDLDFIKILLTLNSSGEFPVGVQDLSIFKWDMLLTKTLGFSISALISAMGAAGIYKLLKLKWGVSQVQ